MSDTGAEKVKPDSRCVLARPFQEGGRWCQGWKYWIL